MDNDFVARIGTFFYLVGIGLLLLFIASDTTASRDATFSVNYNYLCFSTILIGVGFLFRKRAAPPAKAERFKSLRKMRENSKKKKEEKAKQQKK